MNITDYIGVGKDNAVTRQQLCAVTGLPDRTVRKLIAQARTEGEVICNAQDGRGYYITDDVKELQHQYLANHSRAMSILQQQKHLRKRIDEHYNSGQMRLTEG